MSALLCVMAAVLAAPGLNDELETFPIGFWNYAPIGVFDEAKVQEWQDAGMTLTMGPEFSDTPADIALMKQILDWSEARDIKVIVCDPRTRARTLPDDYAERVARAAEDFGRHPATFGFHLLDEPGVEEMPHVIRGTRIAKKSAPKLHPFVNHLPWYPGAEKRVGYEGWPAYLDDFVAKSDADFLCYDCYTQMLPEQSGWASYFRNLNEYGAAARRNGVPFWNTILSVGHFHYQCPSEDDIRWQFNTSIAYGAQGILYFFFYMRQPHDNYRLAPIDEFWDRTPTFESLKRTNKGFVKRYGRLFLDLTLEKAMQWPEPMKGCLPFEADSLIKDVSADGQRALVVSEFLDNAGRPWVVVVNNSVEESCLATLRFAGADTQVFQMNWDNQERAYAMSKEKDHVKVGHWLAPGQMEVFRVAQ